MLIFDAPPPAIIHPAPLVEVHFGLSIGISQVEYDRFSLPRDFRGATLRELLPYLPADLRHMPPWALLAMLPGTGAAILASAAPGVKTTTFLTTTSASDQTWTVLAAWNSGDNSLNVISAGAHGVHGDTSADNGGDGGGGGGFAKATNQPLTPSGSSKYRLRDANVGTGVANACWIGGSGTTTLATSLCGIQSAGGRTAGSITSAIGSTKNAGGGGGAGAGAIPCGPGGGSGGGGGAAGPNGGGSNGGDASGPSDAGGGNAGPGGGSGGNPGGNGSEFGGLGSGGGGNGIRDAAAGDGGLYGGGGGGAGGVGTIGVGKQALIVTINNASL